MQNARDLAAPIVAAPVMLAEWKILPDEGQRLVYRSGSLTPVNGGRRVRLRATRAAVQWK
jgi:hypothetical protein